jgi:hypothetical protein
VAGVQQSMITLIDGSTITINGTPRQVVNELSRSFLGLGSFREFREDVGTRRVVIVNRAAVAAIREVL